MKYHYVYIDSISTLKTFFEPKINGENFYYVIFRIISMIRTHTDVFGITYFENFEMAVILIN